ncbi:MAG: glycosyltransferase family 4 protein [Chitinophagales bacterium]
MHIIYVYFNDLAAKTGDVPQIFNMLHTFAKSTEITFLSAWASQHQINSRLSDFHLYKNFNQIRIPIKLIQDWKFLERFTRAIYCLGAILFVRLHPKSIIYTRDFSFLYFLSLLPPFLRPKNQIYYEPHKIYHLSSSKVNIEQEQKALKIPHLFFPISKGIQVDLIQLFNIDNQRIEVASDGVDIKRFQTSKPNDAILLKEKYPFAANKKVIIYTGSFLEWKGVEVLVKAIKFIQSTDFCVLLIGGSPQKVNAINALCETEKVAHLVAVEGFVTQNKLIPLVRAATIAVIPNTKAVISQYYTSPLKVFEYMAVGLPIVASDLPSLREILTEKEHCLFFEAENPRSLAEKLDFLLQNEIFCNQMRANNLLSVQKYDWQIRADKILSTISMFNKPPSP